MNFEKIMTVLNKKEILISDTCILIDLVELDLLVSFFKLDFVFTTTPQVINEITNSEQFTACKLQLDNGNLIVDSKGSLQSIQQIFDNCPGLSFVDCSVVELALRMQGTVITSDKHLRNTLKRHNVQARGMLWVIELLSKSNIVSNSGAISKLQRYSEMNKWAPREEIERLISRLGEE